MPVSSLSIFLVDPPQGGAADAQLLGSSALIAVILPYDSADDLSFDLIQRTPEIDRSGCADHRSFTAFRRSQQINPNPMEEADAPCGRICFFLFANPLK